MLCTYVDVYYNYAILMYGKVLKLFDGCVCVRVCIRQDRALPLAVKTSCVHGQLRLCNKLAELLLQLGQYGDALEYAQTALEISVSLGK